MTNDEIGELIRKMGKLGIKVYEGGGEIWYDDYGKKYNRSDMAKIQIGLWSRKIQENKIDFVEFLWKRDKETNGKEGKLIVDGMVGKRGFGKL